MSELEIENRLIEIDAMIDSLQAEKQDLLSERKRQRCDRMKHQQLTIQFEF